MENEILFPGHLFGIALYSPFFFLNGLCRLGVYVLNQSIRTYNLRVGLVAHAIDLVDLILAEMAVGLLGSVIQVADLLINP